MCKFGCFIFIIFLFLFGLPINTYGYQGEENRGLIIYGPEVELEFELEYLVSTGNSNRDIDTVSLNILKESHDNGSVAFYKGITITRAWGDMTRLGVTSDCEAYGIGPTYLVRIRVMEGDNAALFFDMSGALIFYDKDFPTNGDFYNFMWRIGPKFSYQIGEHTLLNIGYKLMHVSNGQWHWSTMKPSEHNPSYNAKGLSLTIEHCF